MAHYHFVTEMTLGAPRERVWAVVADPEGYAGFWRWCKRVDTLAEGDADGLGARHRLHFGTALPYTLSFDSEVVRSDPPSLLEVHAEGELRGTGRWTLAGGDITTVTYEWLVETTKRWMNALAPVARPAFSWNHDVLMKDFAAGLAAASGGTLVSVDNSTVAPGDPSFQRLR